MDIFLIVVVNGIFIKFFDDVLFEVDEVLDQISEMDIVGCRDLRNQFIVIIDGEDVKDLDDVVMVKKLENGNYFFGVYIVDVFYYVM